MPAIRRNKFLDGWFFAFPCWSLAFYEWCFSRFFFPMRTLSPLFPADDPHHIPYWQFYCFMACLFLVMATVLMLIAVLSGRDIKLSRKIAWGVLAFAIPPIGAPLAYFFASTEPSIQEAIDAHDASDVD